MFFNVVILNFISMITTPYVFQRCDFDLLDLIDDGCKKPHRCKKPHGVFCNQKNRCKNAKNPWVFCNWGFLQSKLTNGVFCNASRVCGECEPLLLRSNGF